MKVLRFPGPDGTNETTTSGVPAAVVELEAALHDDATGLGAKRWRELRADVRALAPPMPAELERRLLAEMASHAERRPRTPWIARLRARLGASTRNRASALGAVAVLVFVATLVIAAPWRGSHPAPEIFQPDSGGATLHAFRGTSTHAAPQAAAVPSSGASAVAQQSAPSGRVQQRAAALTLAARTGAVQSLADEVARIAVREGGFVQSSQVSTQSGSAGNAELRLSLPSTRLSGALGALGRLASVRAESQSLQDITDEYDAARAQLQDAVAERQALLRTLARAGSQSEIESLHERIALAAAAVTRARDAFQAISRRGSNSTVEVTLLGAAHPGAARSTLGQGWHNALDVLKVSLAIALVALAVFVPLALIALAIGFAWRSSRRRLRERALS